MAEAQQRVTRAPATAKPKPEPGYVVRRRMMLGGQQYERGQTVSAEIVESLPRGEALVRSGYLDRS